MNRALIEKEITQGVVPIGTPTAYKYDASLVEVAKAQVKQGLAEANTILSAIKSEYGYPFTASTSADMTDHSKIYVYTGTTDEDFTNGHWYFYNGESWEDGGIYNSVAFETDKTLSVADMPADAKVVGEKFDYVGNKIILNNGYINNNDDNKWITSVGGKHAVYPVKGGEVVHYVANASTKSSFAVLKTYNYESGVVADFSAETGWQQVIITSSGGSFNTVLPDDAQYVYFYYSAGDVLRYPQVLEIDGFDVIKTIVENEEDVCHEVSRENLVLGDITNHGYMSSGKWAGTTSNDYIHAVYPVNGGETIELVARDDLSCSVASLRSYCLPKTNDSVDFSTESGWEDVIIVPRGKTFKGVIPLDAKVVYTYFSAEGTPRYPKSLKINGYDIIKTVHENIVASGNELLNVVDEYNSNVILKDWKDKSESTLNGITYSVVNDVISLSGTATGIFNFNFYGSVSNIPDWVVAGKRYFMQTNQTGENQVNVKVSLYDTNGDFLSTIFSSTTDGDFTIPNDLSDVGGLLIKINEPIGTILDCTLSPKVLNAPPNSSMFNLLGNKTETKVKIMQYNIGRYNYGDVNNEGLPADIYDEKLLGWRRYFTTTSPDILCMQEVLQYLDHAETHLANDVLWDFIFPFKKDLFSYKRAIKGKYPISYVGTKMISATIDETVYNITYAHCKVYVNEKELDVVTTALPSTRTQLDYQKRAILLPQILDDLAEVEYAFIVLDMNSGGNGDNITSIQEDESLLAMARTKGWEFAMGSYLPFERTYHVLNRVSAIDNIVYKNNGKVIFNNFVINSDWYDELASDHYPVYGEFILL